MTAGWSWHLRVPVPEAAGGGALPPGDPAPSAGRCGGTGRDRRSGLASLTPLHAALAIVFGLTLLRVAGLAATGLELHGDEAQYWSWAQHLGPGYYTKPPLVAWMIAATTALCGDGEACVRVSSPLLHAAVAMGLYALGRGLAGDRQGPRVGLWAAALWITLPSVAFSSLIVSTDVPLLACWTLALLALRRTLDTRARGRLCWAWATAAGSALGLGLLAKYAMTYAVPGFVLHLLLNRDDRWIMRDPRGLLILALALAILAPNLAWNAGHQFATVQHVRDNANLTGALFNPAHALTFLGQQAGVFGPLPFAVLLWRTVALLRGRASAAERYLLAFALPPLAIVALQAVLSRAHANWAATAYPSAAVLVALWLSEPGRARAWRLWAVGPHLAVGLVFLALVAAWPGIAPRLLAPAFARLSGWTETAGAIRPVLDSNPGLPVLTTDRMTMASLLYYLRDRLREGGAGRDDGRIATWIWDWNDRPDNQYELADRFRAGRDAAVLLITDWPDPAPVLAEYAEAEEIADLSAARPGAKRTLMIWRLSKGRAAVPGPRAR